MSINFVLQEVTVIRIVYYVMYMLCVLCSIEIKLY